MIWNLATCSGSNSIPEEESRSSLLAITSVSSELFRDLVPLQSPLHCSVYLDAPSLFLQMNCLAPLVPTEKGVFTAVDQL